MNNQLTRAHQPIFERLKISKKQQLTKNSFLLEFEIPHASRLLYEHQAGQFVKIKFEAEEKEITRDYSFVSAPYEQKLALAIKTNTQEGTAKQLFENYQVGDFLQVSQPMGRFTLNIKPNEKRTILGFASGIGITPIFSHIKNILHQEKGTRFFLFYSNKLAEDIVFKDELSELQNIYGERFNVYYFFSQETQEDAFFNGRLDEKKIELIINQILNLDEEDEETTIWDQVDEILICGPGDMIKSVANACFKNGIPKKSIHFELFENYNEDIFSNDETFPLLEDISVRFTWNHQESKNIILADNQEKILPQLLSLGYKLPYSCKSGICGACTCKLEEGEVMMTTNEYLTDNELKQNYILPCTSIALTQKIILNFDGD